MGIREARIARETADFVRDQILRGTVLGNAFRAAKEGTQHFKEEDSIELTPRGPEELHPNTITEITNEKSLVTAQRLHRESYHEPCVLNFADAFVPGGLFFEGATTQEESICRATGLYQCLEKHELYARNANKTRGGIALHDMLLTHGLPVFRDPETEKFIEEAGIYNISVITSAAPNVHMELSYSSGNAIEERFRERIRRLLTVLSNSRKEAIVLGAWGCGVFGNNPEMVSKAFNEALTTTFKQHFKKVVFPIYDRSSTTNINTFRRNITTT
eukprot:g5895.t1